MPIDPPAGGPGPADPTARFYLRAQVGAASGAAVASIEAPPSAARSLGVVVAVFLAGILVGRLVLERTGAGLVALAFLLPVVFILGAAMLGVGRAALLLAMFAGTALLVRVVVEGTGWVVLLLVPPIALTAYILASTLRVMAQREGKGE